MKISIPYVPTPKQALFHASKADEILYGGAAGGGKELWVGTLIPTPNGFIPIGELHPGDMVFGTDGIPHKVIQCSTPKVHDAYRFIFDDGSSVLCNGEHLWFTYTASDLSKLTKRTDEYRKRRRIGSVKTADEIVETLKVRGRANHAIPVCSPLVLPEKEYPLDPYLLGLWLGDGASSGGAFTSADGLEQAFADAGFVIKKYTDKYTWRINGLISILCGMGLVNNKHVPTEYLWGSIEQRRGLLQGLMDTDGNCNKNGSAEFTNENLSLVEAAAHLVTSLGMKCHVTSGDAKLNGVVVAKKYRIKFVPNQPVFRLPRKLERQKLEQRRTTRLRYLIDVERVPSVEMRCIAIDSKDHLYLASENLIPTHNTKALIMDALFRCLKHPGITAAIFRRTYRELDDTDIKEAIASYPKALATFSQARREFSLINGSKILFRHCENAADRFNYSGIEIQALYFDELTGFEKEIYDFLKTRLRAKRDLGVRPLVRSASNPGNIGHGWVKSYFVDAAPYMHITEHSIYSETLGREQITRTQYIPSLASENPHITDDYIFQLEQKPKALRDALLNGDWNAFEGQVFAEWRDDPDHYVDRRWTHVIEPFEIPLWWPRMMGFDHGYTKPFAVQWYAVSPDDTLILYREWYGCRPGEPDVGIQLSPSQIAAGILEREEEETKNNLQIDRIADSAIFDGSRGPSVAEQMRPDLGHPGVVFRKSEKARIAGLNQVHERMRFDSEGRTRLQVFRTCKDFIRTVPNLPYNMNSTDSRKVEDVDTRAEDHAYDCLRYVAMGRPVSPVRPSDLQQKKSTQPDPFDRW